jgi:hypothetical protein
LISDRVTVPLRPLQNVFLCRAKLQAVCAENLIRVGGVRESAILAAWIALILFVLGILASPFKAKSRVCTKNLIRVDDATESVILAE